ncbi:MAG: endolytic transglycosylase MltG [Bacillus sp. (in: firmicutes)]
MNKRSIRSFALGVFFSVSLIGSYYSFIEKNHTAVPDTKEAEKQLSNNGYTIIKKEEFEQLQTQLKQAEEQLKEKKKETAQEKKTTQEETNFYELYIVKGMTISQIAEQLANKNIIDNKEGFENYLIKNNYHTKVQIGKFALTNKMNYKEIAEIMTK